MRTKESQSVPHDPDVEKNPHHVAHIPTPDIFRIKIKSIGVSEKAAHRAGTAAQEVQNGLKVPLQEKFQADLKGRPKYF